MKKRILALILSGCMILQNSVISVQAADIPLSTYAETENEETVDESENLKSDSEDIIDGSDDVLTGENVTNVSENTEDSDEESNSKNTSDSENVSEPDNMSNSEDASDQGNTLDSEDASDPDNTSDSGNVSDPDNATDSDNISDLADESDSVDESVSENASDTEDPSEGLADAISADYGSDADEEASQSEHSIRYAYVETEADTDSDSDADTDIQSANATQKLGTSKGLYFGYVVTDADKHLGTLQEYVSDSGSITLPHKLDNTYMVEIGDSAFAGMASKDPSDTSKLPDQSTADKTLLSSGESKILELINAARIKKGVAPLIMDKTLRETARRKTLDMFNRNYFTHEDPDTGANAAFTWLGNCGYPREKLGENLAFNYESAEQLYNQWHTHTAHNNEMMSENYRTIGIGVYKDKDGKYMGTQIFSSVVFQNITNVTIEFGYEKINNKAFENCSNLKTITIPSTVTTIASNAFDGCSDDLTIRGKEGSYAQTYAQSRGITFKAIKEKSPIEKFGFVENEIYMEVNDWDYVGVGISPADYEHLLKVQWQEVPEKGNSKVLDRQDDGTIKALAKGTVTVKANAGDLEDTCTITVGDAITLNVEKIGFFEDEIALYEGESIRPAYKIEPVNTTDTIRLTSSNQAVFRVDDSDASMITAVKAGNATLTVSGIKSDNSVSYTASIDVKVLTSDNNLKIPENITAITNISPTLNGVELPDGFSWKEPQTKLKANNNTPVQYFAAQYENVNKNILQDCIIPVAVSTVSGIQADMEGISLPSSKKLSNLEIYELMPVVKYTGADIDPAYLEISAGSDHPGIVSIGNVISGGKTPLFLTPQNSGKCGVTLELKLKDRKGSLGPSNKPYGTFKKKYTFQVEDAAYVSDFQVSLASENQPEVSILENGTIQAEENATKFRIKVNALDVNGDTKNTALTFKADKNKVVTVKAVKGQRGVAEITVKKTGIAVVTVTAKDNGKRSKDIVVYVKQFSPQLNVKSVTLNKYKPEIPAYVDLTEAEDNPISGYGLYNDKRAENVANLFSIQYNDKSYSYEIGFKGNNSSNVTKGSYKLYLKVATTADEYVYPITVKLKNTKPTLKFKQSAKINLFYKDASARLEINSGTAVPTEIVQVDIVEGMPHFEADFEQDENKTWSAIVKPIGVTENNYKKIVKTIDLRFYYEDYGDDFSIIKKINISSHYKKLSLTPAGSQPVIYSKTGIDQTVFRIKEKDTGNILTIGGENNVSAWLDASMSSRVLLTAEDGEQEIHLQLIDGTKKGLTVNVRVSHDNWREDLICPVKLTINNKVPSLALDQTKVTLNTNEIGKEVWDIKAYVNKNDDVDIVRFRQADIVGVNSASKKLLSENKIAVYPYRDGSQRRLKVALNTNNVKSGTYKYKVSAWCLIENGETKKISTMSPVTLSIKITNKKPTASVKAKGKINILSPGSTGITYTPKLANVTGDIRTATLTGEYASQFILTQNSNGTYDVKLRKDSKIGEGKYKLYFKFVLENGVKVESKAFTIKL
ncbi:MAG: leucine-rich repeat protein [Lachnospiraceae bacterium]|nr:leucine-rich repeat protein [Lachnospiraceae bacterium]